MERDGVMAEKGQVIERKENLVVIKMTRTEACAKCSACFVGAGMSSKDIIVEADNECDANIGDWVEMELRENGFFMATLIMYGLPFLGLMAGIILGYFTVPILMPQVNQEVVSFVLGLIFMTGVLFWIRSQESRWEGKKYRPAAARITTDLGDEL